MIQEDNVLYLKRMSEYVILSFGAYENCGPNPLEKIRQWRLFLFPSLLCMRVAEYV